MLLKVAFVIFSCVLLWPVISNIYAKMTDSVTQPKKSRNRKRKGKNSTGEEKLKTIVERQGISPNWQSFLQIQTATEKKPKEEKNDSIKREISAYWKTKRLEKKANLKVGDSPSQNLSKLDINRSQETAENNNRTSVKGKKLFAANSQIEEIIQTNTYWKAKRLAKKGIAQGAKEKPQVIPNSNSIALEVVDESNNIATVEKYDPAKNKKQPVITKYVAIDCEMVGVGENGRDSILARVSIVNKFGDCIYDKFVKPREKVTDYRTPVSGVRKEDLQGGECFEVVQREVAEILKGRFLVGHSLRKDLEVLFLSHPKRKIRDTSKYKPFRRLVMGGTPSLRVLAQELLGVKIQSGEHSSVEDSRAAMQLYTSHQRHWEASLLARDRKNN